MGAGGAKYPERICMPCGERHGHRGPSMATWYPGKCECCGDPEAMVCDPSFFGELRMGWRERQRELSVRWGGGKIRG